MGLDLLDNPDLLCIDEHAARSAGWYWMSRGCNWMADCGDIVKITRAVNGGTNGLEDRKARWLKAKAVLIV